MQTVHRLAERRPVGMVSFGVFLFSIGPVIIGSASVSGPVFSFWRLWIGVLLLGTATLVHRHRTGRRTTRTGWWWAAKAGAAFGIHQLLFMSALKATTIVDVTLMNTLAPIFVAVLAVPLFGERPGARFRMWSGVAILGTVAVVLAGSSGPGGNPVGMLLAAGNVAFYALYFVWSKQSRAEIDTVPYLFGVALAAALTVSIFVTLFGEPVGSVTAHDLLLCAVVAIVPGAIGHFSVTWPLHSVPANLPPVLMLSIPLLSGLMAWVFLGQGVTGVELVGGALTLAGVAGAVWTGTGTPTATASLTQAEET